MRLIQTRYAVTFHTNEENCVNVDWYFKLPTSTGLCGLISHSSLCSNYELDYFTPVKYKTFIDWGISAAMDMTPIDSSIESLRDSALRALE